jgi:tetratricopeptide (TPR) repeat protein
MRKTVLVAGLLLSVISYGQTNREEAQMKKDKAVELMDNGKPDEAILLLEEAKKLDPEHSIYDYEKAYAYYIKNDIKTSLKIFKTVVKYKDTGDQSYQMLGNLFDIDGQPDQALKTYAKGLKKFPASGRLYLETGNVYFNQKKYGEALPLYEKGIQVEPLYPSNYYRATLIYCSSSEVVWGMIYGEIFLNLERNSKRTTEISNLLFNSYKNHIEFKPDTTRISFSKTNVISVESIKRGKMPFGSFVYEPLLSMALPGETGIDINSLDRIRTRFVENYFVQNFSKDHRNILFEYQKRIQEWGHLEAYNHWVLMSGDADGFAQWKGQNGDKWENFLTWFKENRLELNDRNKFYREQY